MVYLSNEDIVLKCHYSSFGIFDRNINFDLCSKYHQCLLFNPYAASG